MVGPAHVLIVDDNADLRGAVSLLLQFEGHAVVEAADGQLALDALSAGTRIGVIILDLMMPVMDGWQLHDELCADDALAAIPVVVITAHRESAPFACAGRLLKPVPLRELLAVIARIVAGRGAA